jgi:hypothetical protein
VLCTRTRNILVFGMLATAVTLDMAPAPSMHEVGALPMHGVRCFAFDALSTTALATPLLQAGALAPQCFTFDALSTAASALPPQGAAALAPQCFAFDVLAVAADALPSIGQAPQHFLSDSGASIC